MAFALVAPALLSAARASLTRLRVACVWVWCVSEWKRGREELQGKAAADDSERTMERLRGLCMQTIRRDEMYQRSGPRGEDLPKVKPKKTRITKSYSRLAERFREKIAA